MLIITRRRSLYAIHLLWSSLQTTHQMIISSRTRVDLHLIIIARSFFILFFWVRITFIEEEERRGKTGILWWFLEGDTAHLKLRQHGLGGGSPGEVTVISMSFIFYTALLSFLANSLSIICCLGVITSDYMLSC